MSRIESIRELPCGERGAARILKGMELKFDHAARTHAGRVRRENEDALFGTSRLVAVADGVGGHVAGEVASRVAIDMLASLDKPKRRAGAAVA